jgi:hypothetical protein
MGGFLKYRWWKTFEIKELILQNYILLFDNYIIFYFI